MCKFSTVSHTKCVYSVYLQNKWVDFIKIQKNGRCFLRKFTEQANALHDHQSRQRWMDTILKIVPKKVVFETFLQNG